MTLIPLGAYVVFLLGHAAALALAGPVGFVLLMCLAGAIPIVDLSLRRRLPPARWRMLTLLGVIGAAGFIGGVLWNWSIEEPSNDIRPVFVIIAAHLTLITSAVIALVEKAPPGRRRAWLAGAPITLLIFLVLGGLPTAGLLGNFYGAIFIIVLALAVPGLLLLRRHEMPPAPWRRSVTSGLLGAIALCTGAIWPASSTSTTAQDVTSLVLVISGIIGLTLCGVISAKNPVVRQNQ